MRKPRFVEYIIVLRSCVVGQMVGQMLREVGDEPRSVGLDGVVNKTLQSRQ